MLFLDYHGDGQFTDAETGEAVHPELYLTQYAGVILVHEGRVYTIDDDSSWRRSGGGPISLTVNAHEDFTHTFKKWRQDCVPLQVVNTTRPSDAESPLRPQWELLGDASQSIRQMTAELDLLRQTVNELQDKLGK